MTPKEALAQLKALGDEKVRKVNTKAGCGKDQFGVSRGDLRILAKKIKTDDALARALWKTGNADAQFLATLIIKPKSLSAAELDDMARTVAFSHVAEWLMSYILKEHPDKETLRQKWMKDKDPWAARAGWALTSERISKKLGGVDPSSLLDRIESEMGEAPPQTQWTMNNTLAAIGINEPKLRKRALAIGEKLGVYRDYPCAKGCVSPFAPIWITEMVKRQG